MESYPKNIFEFDRLFESEKTCAEYLASIRWADGFICPKCKGTKYWQTGSGHMMCTICNQRAPVKAGTIFQDSRIPLRVWFMSAWWVAGQKNGCSAKGLQRSLGLGSYETAWTILHKLRKAMVFPDRKLLSGIIEADETYIGGKKPGPRGRGAEGKTVVAIAVEDKRQEGFGRIRLESVRDASSDSLIGFLRNNVTEGSRLRTDGWASYAGVEKFKHLPTSKELKLVHRIASLLKRWLTGTHQGAVAHEHLQSYLDEFVFRFNRRTSRSRGLLFRRLLENAMRTPPFTYKAIIKNVGNHKR
jgi:transposase-like protein